MNRKSMCRAAVTAALAAAGLAACGGSSSPDSAIPNQYVALLPQSASATTLAGTGLQDSFSTAYLDAGTTKPQLVSALAQTAAALQADPNATGFPVASISGATITDCSGSLCTFSGTLVNSDADATSVPFSTKVIFENGSYRLYGDQQAS